MNWTIIVGFDVDMTLVNEVGAPIYENIQLLLSFYAKGCKIWVASGGGLSYTQLIVRRLGLADKVECYEKIALPGQPDIWFDDMEGCKIGKLNIRV